MKKENPAIVLGCDHGAIILKETIKSYLTDSGESVEDVGTHSSASVDYPVYGKKVAKMISEGVHQRGILLCGTGLGMSMVANRFPNVRAALCNDLFSAQMCREHNDANILVLGGRIIGDILAIKIVRTFLDTPFGGGRHSERLEQFNMLNPLG